MRRTLYTIRCHLAALRPGGVFGWLALFLLAGPAWAQPGPSGPAPLYAVVFEATVDAAGRIESLKVSQVIDPSSGSTDPVTIEIPDSYVKAAQASLLQRTYPAAPRTFFTYLFYDPAQPARADIDPRAGKH